MYVFSLFKWNSGKFIWFYFVQSFSCFVLNGLELVWIGCWPNIKTKLKWIEYHVNDWRRLYIYGQMDCFLLILTHNLLQFEPTKYTARTYTTPIYQWQYLLCEHTVWLFVFVCLHLIDICFKHQMGCWRAKPHLQKKKTKIVIR